MPAPAIGGVIASVGGGLLQRKAEAKATKQAIAAQTEGTNAQIAAEKAGREAQMAENKRTFGVASDLLKPYINAGSTALARQMALLGIGGTAGTKVGTTPLTINTIRTGTASPTTPAASRGVGNPGFDLVSRLAGLHPSQDPGLNPRAVQPTRQNGFQTGYEVGGVMFDTLAEAQAYAQANGTGGTMTGAISDKEAQRLAIQSIVDGSQFEALSQQGEYGILSNAAATGGLRGGNVQGVLAQYRPAMLQQLIDKNIADLGGLATVGGNAAGALGTAAMGQNQDMGQSYARQGVALAERGSAIGAGAIAQGQSASNSIAGITGTIGDTLGRLKNLGAGKGVFGSSWGF
jgi:hypothetical protein